MKTKNWTNEVVFIPPEERTDTSDYLYLLSKGVTPEAREKFHCGDIFINGAVCLYCKDFIRSMNIHDYKMCSCGKVGVDGGSFYIRRIGEEKDYINVIENFSHINKEKGQ